MLEEVGCCEGPVHEPAEVGTFEGHVKELDLPV